MLHIIHVLHRCSQSHVSPLTLVAVGVPQMTFAFYGHSPSSADSRRAVNCCQLLAKECELSTGKLPRRLAQDQCGRVTDRVRNDLKMCWRAVKQKSDQRRCCNNTFPPFPVFLGRDQSGIDILSFIAVIVLCISLVRRSTPLQTEGLCRVTFS